MDSNPNFASIEEAVQDFREGKFLIVTDDESRENEGDLIVAAQFADRAAINFMTRAHVGLFLRADGRRASRELAIARR